MNFEKIFEIQGFVFVFFGGNKSHLSNKSEFLFLKATSLNLYRASAELL